MLLCLVSRRRLNAANTNWELNAVRGFESEDRSSRSGLAWSYEAKGPPRHGSDIS